MGTLRRFDLTGQIFGRWTVLKCSGKRGNFVVWHCRCACGVEKDVYAKSLRSGASKSCGCLCVDLARKAPGYAAQTQLYTDYRVNSAKRRGLVWKISRNLFNKLTQQPCHYCGVSLSNLMKAKYGNGDFAYNGLDRKNNGQGYIPENVLPCCKICQRAKMDMPYAEFLGYLRRVKEFDGPNAS